MKENFNNKSEELEADRDVVAYNLEIINREMKTLSNKESVGGVNAGSVTIEGKTYPCIILNGYADQQTGEIFAFGNFPDIPEEIRDKGIEFSFREAINSADIDKLSAEFSNRSDKFQTADEFLNGLQINTSKIVDFIGADKFSSKGRKNIETTIAEYNAEYWSL